jgi:hypothetical protein
MSLHSQARADSGRARDAAPPTDWVALEQQLCRTKTILQEILDHLQGVLRNLRAARAGYKSHARGGARTARTASAGFGSRPQDQKTARPRPGHARFERAAPGPGSASGPSSGQTRDFRAGQPGTGEGDGARTFGGQRTGTAFGGGQSGDSGRKGNPYRSFAGGRAAGNSAGTGSASAAGSSGQPGQYARFGQSGATGASGQTGQTGSSARFGQTGASGQTGQSGASGPYGRNASGQSRQRETFGQASRPGQSRTSHSSNAYDTRRETVRPDSASRHRFSGERQERGRQAARNTGMNLKCAYDILCLDYPCTPVEIKNAYRGMARMFHPDLGGDEEVMKDVNLAYELAMRFCAGPRRSGASWTA